ncbi:MAG: AAA family ATPase [Nanoarchaeota archaeon]|nr:AAA family ATPase [Nanoarchaeota archaeon]MCG2718909.1 AAA family ATPase [Nanoarchaeota archaeon]
MKKNTYLDKLLYVAQSDTKHKGKKVAQLSKSYMDQYGLKAGDIVLVSPLNEVYKTPVKVIPKVDDDEIINLDVMTRTNANTCLDEKVTLTPIQASKADSIHLIPLGDIHPDEIKARYANQDAISVIKKQLQGQPLTKGDIIRLQLYADRTTSFKVDYEEDVEAVIANTDTEIKIIVDSNKENGKTFNDIGGLEDVLEEVKRIIEGHSKYPGLYNALGGKLPKNFLLTGPPGTGKSLLAEAIAHETDRQFAIVQGGEIKGWRVGDSENNLIKAYEQLNGHGVFFVDEIDAIGGKREDMINETEKSIVTTLLNIMSGMKYKDDDVIIIGATNRPEGLDPALRRPGRFDKEIYLGVPNRDARRDILLIHTANMPFAEEIDIPHIANITYGYTGADIEGLCNLLVLEATKKYTKLLEKGLSQEEVMKDVKYSMADFLKVMKSITPSGMRDVIIEKPNISWDQIGGNKVVKKDLKQILEWPQKYKSLMSKMNAEMPKGILLYGVPGTGKTLIAKAIATESDYNFISIKGPEFLNQYVGASEKGVRDLFKKARQHSPTVIFLDELDSIAPVRRSGGERTMENVVSQILTELDGVERLSDVVIVGATNRPDLIDPALKRPGRLDLHYEIEIPAEKAREEIFKIHAKNTPLAKDVNLKGLAKITENYVGAEIEGVVKLAKKYAMEEFIEKHKDSSEEKAELCEVTKKHFLEALKQILPKSYEASYG